MEKWFIDQKYSLKIWSELLSIYAGYLFKFVFHAEACWDTYACPFIKLSLFLIILMKCQVQRPDGCYWHLLGSPVSLWHRTWSLSYFGGFSLIFHNKHNIVRAWRSSCNCTGNDARLSGRRANWNLDIDMRTNQTDIPVINRSFNVLLPWWLERECSRNSSRGTWRSCSICRWIG